MGNGSLEIGNKLTEVRNRLGMNKKQFAAYLGLNYTTYNNYEVADRGVDSAVLTLIAQKCKVSTDWILGLSEEPELLTAVELTSSEIKQIEKYRKLDSYGREAVDFILNHEYSRMEERKEEAIQDSEEEAATEELVPTRFIVYFNQFVSAGTGELIFDTPPTDSIEIPDLPEYKKADYAITVKGDSMKPIYDDGDILLVESTEVVEVGEIGIFSLSSNAYVKKLGQNELISANPEYERIPLDDSIRCFGRVVGKYENREKE